MHSSVEAMTASTPHMDGVYFSALPEFTIIRLKRLAAGDTTMHVSKYTLTPLLRSASISSGYRWPSVRPVQTQVSFFHMAAVQYTHDFLAVLPSKREDSRGR